MKITYSLRSILVTVILLCMAVLACSEGSAASGGWLGVKGCYYGDNDTQYSCARLMLKYVNVSKAVFELRVTEGSESAQTTNRFVYSGIIDIDRQNVGHFVSEDYQLTFSFDQDRKNVVVTSKGQAPTRAADSYQYVETISEVTPETAVALLRANMGLAASQARFAVAKEGLKGWFYPVTVSDLPEKDLGGKDGHKYLVAKDLSSIYEFKNQKMELRFGDNSSMMQAETTVERPKDCKKGEDECCCEDVPVVNVSLSEKTVKVGAICTPIVHVPAPFSYTITVTSSNHKIVTVNDGGEVEALAPGEAVITFKISIDGASKQCTTKLKVLAK